MPDSLETNWRRDATMVKFLGSAQTLSRRSAPLGNSTFAGAGRASVVRGFLKSAFLLIVLYTDIVVTDLVQIRRLGEKKREENLRFRRHLKDHYYPELRFRRVAESIEEQIDCTQCANCCREAIVPLKPRDVAKLAGFLRVSEAAFLEKFTARDEEGGLVLRRTEAGCVFLEGNLCSVYEARPGDCARYPHLVRGEGPISTRMWRMVDRASCCPIVYNAVEAYKDIVGFRRRG